ncbi:MAG: deoxyribonuclease IV, partial [Candidatus Limnocylindrus sp.]
ELPKELPAFRARIKEHCFGPVAVHAAYLANLAGPRPEVREKSIAMLQHELRVAPAYGASFVNVHIGSHLGTGIEAGVTRVAEAVDQILDGVPAAASDALLVLENSAGGGNGIGESIDELIAIHDAMAKRRIEMSRVGYCLDSAHLWGAGVEMSDLDELDRVIDEFDRKIGLEKLVMIHYNDSKAAHGSKLDRHQHIGGGEVGARGLAALISHPKLAHAAYYLETPGMEEGWDKLNVERTIQLAQGNLKLKPLPAEAPGVPKPAKKAAKPVAAVKKAANSAKAAKPAAKKGAAKRSAAKRSVKRR